MPSRRALLAGLAGLTASPLTAAAGATPTRDPPVGTPAAESDDSDAPPVDASAAVGAVESLDGSTFGRVDFATLRAARRAAGRRDSEPLAETADLDARLAPALGRGLDAPAGLRSLSGRLSAATAASRLRELARPESDGVVRGRIERHGDALSVATPAAVSPAVDSGAADAAAADRRIRATFADADAYVGFVPDGGAASLVADDHPARRSLASLSAFGLGAERAADGPRLRAHFVAGEGFDARAARTVLGAFGVPAAALADATATRSGDGLTVRASLDGTQRGLGVLLVLLVLPALVGTYVLGLGEPVERRSPAPQVAFGFERRSSGRVAVTHEAGDHVDGLTVVYEHDAEGVRERWAGPVRAGDRYVTSRAVDDGSTVRLLWRGEDGGSTVLAEYTAT